MVEEDRIYFNRINYSDCYYFYKSDDLGYIFQFDPGYSSNGALIFRKRTSDWSGESKDALKDSGGNTIEINPLDFKEFNDQGQDFWTNEHKVNVNVNQDKEDDTKKKVEVYVDNVLVTGKYDIKVDALTGEQENKTGFRTWGGVQATIKDLNIKPLE